LQPDNGGTFDYEAGKIKRAPKVFQKLGIEWLWRLCREPKRIVRMMVLPEYLIKIVFAKDKTKGRWDSK
jgi:N-acetylglucosaminyldiphosphoundecaprenol N-acetyl-beta-D-mannosaminyltransferase